MNSSILQAIESLCYDIATSAKAVLDIASNCIDTSEEIKKDNRVAGVEKGKIEIPKPGDQFEYNDVMFTVLGEEQGGVLAIVSELLKEEMPFDEILENDWRTSSLRGYLNGEYLKQFNRGDLLPFISDLTADDGMKDYGSTGDYVFLLSCDLYRKYRESIPHFDVWWWTLTPWTCRPNYTSSVRTVTSSGVFSESNAYNKYGIAPAVLFNPRVFE